MGRGRREEVRWVEGKASYHTAYGDRLCLLVEVDILADPSEHEMMAIARAAPRRSYQSALS